MTFDVPGIIVVTKVIVISIDAETIFIILLVFVYTDAYRLHFALNHFHKSVKISFLFYVQQNFANHNLKVKKKEIECSNSCYDKTNSIS